MFTAQAQIDLNAIKHNLRVLRKMSDNRPVIAVIKGDAYGHDAIRIAKALTDADKFAVARIEEGIELRKAGINQPILLLEGCFSNEDLVIAADLGFETVIHNHTQIKQLNDIKSSIKIWLKIDTGMHRVGFMPNEIADLVTELSAQPHVLGDINFISHLSCADNLESPSTQKQIDIFTSTTALYAGEKTLANSAGILCWDAAHFDKVRAGIALYGISPFENKIGKDFGLIPVMSLQTKVISIRRHKAGEPVGYGETWFAKKDTHIAVVAMGYGDGYPRLAPNGTPVWINGKLYPISGRVSMDMITVDIGNDSGINVGDTVEFFGKNLPIETVSNAIGTIPYELTIKLTQRVKKRFVE